MKKKNCLTSNGYIRKWNPKHPLATADGNVLEHRQVYFDYHGSIPKGFHIHHKDGNKTNNSIKNLEAISNSDHQLEHRTTGSKIKNQYGEHIVKPLEERISTRKANKEIYRKCNACSKEFNMKRRDAKYCSSNCRVGSWKRRSKVALSKAQ